MPKTDAQTHPWIAKAHFDLLLTRCADAEAALRRVLDFVNPDLLVNHSGDWKAAVEELCDE